ncbi:MAG: GTP cyclohydrolase I FolE [Bacteroidetes bacterium]|nr:GTP cyclohydrolase I FolE [Bacteroidota bacterium]
MDTKELSVTEDIGDNHIGNLYNVPLRADAFSIDDDTKVVLIQKHFKAIMEILGLDTTDDSLQGTPYRVAKMYVKEIFQGLNPANQPEVKLFDNKYGYHQMLIEKDITFYSTCEHHFVPIYGKAHIAYIPQDKVVGLSKLNRIVQYCARRPQVQERLTIQIVELLKNKLQTDDIIVLLEADHMCIHSRGIQDSQSSTTTLHYSGSFEQESLRQEFLKLVAH